MSLIIGQDSKGIYRLTLAEILYYLPDYEEILQTYVWQEYDYIPDYPKLHKFIAFWQREIDGKLHSINISTQDELGPGGYKISIFYNEIN